MKKDDKKGEENKEEGNETILPTMEEKIREREQQIIPKTKAPAFDIATKISLRSSIKHTKK
jgi:hypothetical protein